MQKLGRVSMENSEKTKISVKNNSKNTGFSSNPPKAKNKEKTMENAEISSVTVEQNREQEGFFDATAPIEGLKQKDMEQEIAKARSRAIQEREILDRLKNTPDTSKKTYISCVVSCLVSVGVLLVLTLVAFVFLKWYPVGIVLALITVVVSQVWIVFFKKLNKHTDEEFDIEDRQREQELQEHLAKKGKNESVKE